MSLGWFDEVIEFDFNSGYFNEITWKNNEGIAGKAAANAYYRKRWNIKVKKNLFTKSILGLIVCRLFGIFYRKKNR